MILYSAIDLTKPPVRYLRNNNRKAIPIRWSVLMHIQDPRIIRDPVHSRTSPSSYPNGKFHRIPSTAFWDIHLADRNRAKINASGSVLLESSELLLRGPTRYRSDTFYWDPSSELFALSSSQAGTHADRKTCGAHITSSPVGRGNQEPCTRR